jgi:hypothetical protein
MKLGLPLKNKILIGWSKTLPYEETKRLPAGSRSV